MNKKSVLSLFIFFLCLVPIVGQTNDTTQLDAVEQTPSKLEILSKERSQLLEALDKGDLNNMREIKDELIRTFDNKTNEAFSTREYLIILYWTEEYNDLLTYITSNTGNIDEHSVGHTLKWLAPPNKLYEVISNESVESYDMLVSFIYEAQLSNEEKEFLELHLYWLLFGPKSIKKSATLPEIHDLADKFSKEYPNNPFKMYIHHNIRFKMGIDDWALGSEIGLGYVGMQGDMAKQFKEGVLFRLSLDGSYKRTTLSISLNIGSTTTKVDFPYRDTEWLSGSQAMLMNIDLTAGYRIVDIKRVSFTPFLGIGAINFSPSTEDIENDYTLEKLNFTAQNYLVGMNFTFNLKKRSFFLDENNFINLRYTFSMPQYNGRKGIESGNMHWITLGWGMNAQSFDSYF